MERWEIVERYVLLAVGAALLAFDGWLRLFSTGPERIAWLALLAPCTFWVFWQALYEDKLGTSQPVTRGERAMRTLWLIGRRVVLWAVAAVCLAGAWYFAESIESPQGPRVAAVLLFVACIAAWVAVYGAGRHKSMSDDVRVHKERAKRYD